MKGLIITVVALAILAAGGYFWLNRGKATAATDTGPTSAKVERRDLKVEVKATGRVTSFKDIPIKCKASGTVEYLPFDVNDEVKQDQVVLRLDTKDQARAVKKAEAALVAETAQLERLKADLAASKQTLVVSRLKAEANLAMAQAKAKDAHSKLDRQRQLLEKKLISGEEFETSSTTAAVADAEAKLAAAQIEDLKTQELSLVSLEKSIEAQAAAVVKTNEDLDIQKQQLEYATVTSPVDGRIASLVSGSDTNNKDIITRVGSLVQSGTGGFSGGTTVMTISDFSQIRVSAAVDESEIRNVVDPQRNPDLPRQRVEVTVDAYKGIVFEGYVDRVATQGKEVSNVVTFEVQIALDSPNSTLLRPVTTANVTIIKAREYNVLAVPAASVILHRDAARGGRGRGTATDAASRPVTAPATQVASDPAGTDPTPAATIREATSRPAGTRPAATRGGRGRLSRPENIVDGPQKGSATVIKADGTEEKREVVVGETDGFYYKVISGLEEGETVLVPKAQAESRFRNAGGARPGAIMGGGRPR